MASTLLTSASLNVSGTANVGSIIGDGSGLTGLSSVTQVNDTETTGVTCDVDVDTVLSVPKTITSGKTVFLIASGYIDTVSNGSAVVTILLKHGSTTAQTVVIEPTVITGSDSWSCCAIVAGLSGEVTFSVTGQVNTGYSAVVYGNLCVLEF